MKQDGYYLNVEHSIVLDGIVWGTELSYTQVDGDATNPIFNEVNDADGFAIATKIAFPGLFGFLGEWAPNLTATYAEEDSDVDFNDSSIWLVGVAVGRTF